jgi:hypothetical protein
MGAKNRQEESNAYRKRSDSHLYEVHTAQQKHCVDKNACIKNT